ncbi:hypothetical protein M514_04307 [Trichuris suis]|uniref:Uncharacterized protein n=1 Tax=Trichuris suis TaxID=68888 RepID=A0A085NQK2_9BILA|nr:hypothetical protein M513_04307 [Trichuris suis]KFD71748.1 hypothetical protein M514_04307 [Trichuris suis]KHJ45992.1 hypothetical protein D918_03655 [Trichuris suis]
MRSSYFIAYLTLCLIYDILRVDADQNTVSGQSNEQKQQDETSSSDESSSSDSSSSSETSEQENKVIATLRRSPDYQTTES